jgi:acyl-homoserine-lactone acylase
VNRLLLCVAAACAACAPSNPEVTGWERQAQNVSIIRDDWGIPHIYGKSDADAVFGMIYAQAEDDFNRVENNYLLSLGRRAEAEGEDEVYRDLRQKLFIDPDTLKALYQTSAESLRALMNAWADGLNYYLHKHPRVKPKVIQRFEPWMALSFTEGSIGGDIEHVNLRSLQAFYGPQAGDSAAAAPEADGEGDGTREPTGSNGFAIAPSNTVSHHAILWINPHTSFFFRAELQMVSDSGLDAYGAVTWGQFFVYQGFNPRLGWMHTSSGVDNIDEYAESVTKRGKGYVYRYGKDERPVVSRVITVPYKTASGMAEKKFTAYFTRHGPVVREEGGKWIATSLMNEPVKALTQSYTRTKAKSLKEYLQIMELHTNSSNNTVFADADGDIAYFHSNFIPRRDPRFDWTKPVDGSNPATDWKGVLSVDETPNAVNPPNGWVYNTNNSPWSAAGPFSPRKKDFPEYVESGTENARALHAIRVLSNKKDFTPASVIAAAFDPYLTAFEVLLPGLLKAYDQTPASNPLKARLSEQVDSLRHWDLKWSASSVPTSLAVFWGEELSRKVGPDARAAGMPVDTFIVHRATAQQKLEALAAASDKLQQDFGSWKTPWGNINRFQRLTGDIVQPFNDSGPSMPVEFTSSRWGSLASFGARAYPNTRKWYGTSGNSFLAVVEFGDSVRARAITAGGESGDPKSPHFDDQAVRYSTGDLRDVYFYRTQLKGHTEREYPPGR